MNRRRDEGLALILVMTVVLALAIIATPFVLSMILQERTGTTARYLSQADYGADGAKNYALWRLMLSLDPVERRTSGGLYSSYYYDTDKEFDIRLDDDPLKSALRISDPKGAIWGVVAQDEQGKLNARTCNVDALQNLARMVDARVVNLKDYITLYSGRDATWIYPQKIRQVGFESGNSSGGGVTVDNLHALAPRSRVRITKAGMRPVETVIRGNAILGSGGNSGFTVDGGMAMVDGVIEVEMRHPVNVNTARRETLIAMWEGLQLWDPKTGRMDPSSLVDRGAAAQLATRFHGRDIQRLEQFLQQLASTSLNMNQKRAVAINAVCPNAALLNQTGTVPICFKSYDVYTLEAFSSMNSPAGTEVAGRGYREVVSVSPPSTLTQYCESQYDFNQMMSQWLTALQNFDLNLAGVLKSYPFGNRMLTYPRPYTMLSDVALKPQQKGAENEAYVTMAPAEDNRGELTDQNFQTELTGWNDPTDPHNRFHYGTEMDGKKTSGPETFPWTQFFALNHTPEDDLSPGQQRPDTGSGGFEIWTRFDGDAGNASFFEIQEQPTTNRVSLRMEGGDLVLSAADSTIPNSADPDGRIANGIAEIRWPGFKVSPNTWTHFSAYWKSNRYADLSMLVDGFSDPNARFMHYTAPGGQKLMTKLSSALTPTSTNLTIQDPGICPSQSELTPLLIGDEVVLYDSKGGVTLRGARGTQPKDHQSQVNVSLYGYSSKIRTGSINAQVSANLTVTMPYSAGIPATNATCTYNFGLNPAATVCGDKQDPTGTFWYVDTAAAQIGVITTNIMDFPDQGYIMVDNEIIYYTGRATGTVAGTMPPATAKFTGLTRAQFGTVAADHRSGANVQMWSIAVSNTAKYPTPSIIQIGDEWFGPVRQDPTRANFWISFIDGTNPIPLRRGSLGTIRGAHSAADKVIPTFLAKDVNGWPSNGYCLGDGDRVTLVDASNFKATARIRHAGPFSTPNVFQGWPANWSVNGGTQIAALWDHASRDWVPDDLHVRILKFPSGELLSRAFLDNANPQVTIGPISGQIDELKAFAASKGRVRLQQLAAVGDATIYMVPTGVPKFDNGGLIKMGDEYVGYGSWTQTQTQGTLTMTKRGWLNSAAEVHDAGESVFYIPWVPVAALAADLTPDDHLIQLKQRLQGDPQKYRKGYVLIDNEMILFEWNGGGGNPSGLTLSMPVRWDGQKGLYRGMFGTQETSHSQTASLVYGIPFRYFDTYKNREFDNSMVYYQWSTKLDLAHWNSVKWIQEIPNGDKNMVIHALIRIDGKGEFWDSPGMNNNVMLVDSIAGGSAVRLNKTGFMNDAGQLDVRFYIEYRQGAFDSTQMRTAESWKRCPKIKEIEVEYDRPTQTLHHEDR